MGQPSFPYRLRGGVPYPNSTRIRTVIRHKYRYFNKTFYFRLKNTRTYNLSSKGIKVRKTG